jgi:ATP-dependent RNA helicase DeaD
VKLGDSYSFVSVPFEDAEQVVRRLNKLRRGNRPLAEIAQPAGAKGAPGKGKEEAADGGEGSSAAFRERRPASRGPKRERRSYGDGGTGEAERGERTFGKKERSGTFRGEKPAGKGKMSRPAERRADDAVETVSAGNGDGGFDWSFFEKDGNLWERPSKGKKRK